MPTNRKISDAENRIRVLYSLRELGMATPEQLWPLVSQLQGIDYLSCCLIVNELKESGDVSEGSYVLSKMLYLTAKGTETLRLFEKRMALTDRRHIRESAVRYSATLNEKRHANILYEGTVKNCTCLHCTVSEADEPLLEMHITTADSTFAEKAVAGFRNAVPGLILLLCSLWAKKTTGTEYSGNITPSEEGNSCLAQTQTEDEKASYRLAFRLPDEKTAEAWLRGADAEPLAPKITALFEEKS